MFLGFEQHLLMLILVKSDQSHPEKHAIPVSNVPGTQSENLIPKLNLIRQPGLPSLFYQLISRRSVTIHVLCFQPATHINLTSTISILTGEYRGLAILRVVSSSPKRLRWRIMQFSFSQKKSEAFPNKED